MIAAVGTIIAPSLSVAGGPAPGFGLFPFQVKPAMSLVTPPLTP